MAVFIVTWHQDPSIRHSSLALFARIQFMLVMCLSAPPHEPIWMPKYSDNNNNPAKAPDFTSEKTNIDLYLWFSKFQPQLRKIRVFCLLCTVKGHHLRLGFRHLFLPPTEPF
ncbi:hypothetical protein ILYODFUR_014028 [Ilyodon furcidens]|uniref:Uncharacterized protein n=1 Tax=Ilyodon furcidens TaxID=33524 RepID=A0ABV0V2V9_9TELE